MHVAEPVTPLQLQIGRWLPVPGGAIAAGHRADALVTIDDDEHARRQSAGIGAVTGRGLLYVLLSLPWGTPVHTGALHVREVEILRAAPAGVVDLDGDWVIRRLQTPLTVAAAVVEGTNWRRVLGRVVQFAPFCQMVAVFPAAPTRFGDVAWEARFDGVGVWVRDDGELVEVVRPEPFRLRCQKAAGWAFHENAYRRWISTTHPVASSPCPEDRPARTAAEASDPLQLALPTA
ncbi:hypothetical protein MAGR_49210 [Mycolicibacterium agri]|uniref:Uncharacterized protein n=2 Tax=Mycolicibacterium agri TaxID=36811 RepID=A0A7I9W7D1_MYCAG|nr:hypothetical protein MAGR_49210 [Mycolicibacterium agri]